MQRTADRPAISFPILPHFTCDQRAPSSAVADLVLVRWLCALAANDAGSRSMIATALLSRSLASRFHRLRELQACPAAEARL